MGDGDGCCCQIEAAAADGCNCHPDVPHVDPAEEWKGDGVECGEVGWGGAWGGGVGVGFEVGFGWGDVGRGLGVEGWVGVGRVGAE